MAKDKADLSFSPTVLILTTAALALPGISQARSQPSATQVELQTSRYSEQDQPRSDVAVGARDRYEVDVHQLAISAPIGENYSGQLSLAREMMSGASPWGTTQNISGEPALIMTGATISDQRTEVSLSLTQHQSKHSFTGTLESSQEQDYKALGFGLSGEIDLNNKHAIVGFGLSYSKDKLSPTEAATYGRVDDEDKNSYSLFGSYTSIIDQSTQVQFGLSYTRQKGYLSDPYKLRDIRPDNREQWALTARYRKYFSALNAALHVNYRYYTDDFDVDSQTLELAWHQNFGEKVRITPSIRYYSQSEADFYVPIDDYSLPDSVSQSSDFRLSGYGALSYGLIAQYHLPVGDGYAWRISLAFEKYRSDRDLSIHKSAMAHPALVDFTLISFGFLFRI